MRSVWRMSECMTATLSCPCDLRRPATASASLRVRVKIITLW